MEALQILLTNKVLFSTTIVLIGLIMGSFLNVVIHRLPIMMEMAWRRECREFLGVEDAEGASPTRFNLLVPRSQCPHCQHPIGAHENIPVVSYLLLGGRCSACRGRISLRYPLVEIGTAFISLAVAWNFGASWQTAWALALSWALISLSMIDIDRRLLPDSITLPFLWLGILLSLFDIFTDSRSSIIGAMAGYGVLWLVYHAFRLITGKEGMGYGDFKLLGALGAWMGWQSVPLILLLSSLVGAVVGMVMIVFFAKDRSVPIPFGPYLATAGWIALLWGSELTDAYLRVSGLQ